MKANIQKAFDSFFISVLEKYGSENFPSQIEVLLKNREPWVMNGEIRNTEKQIR